MVTGNTISKPLPGFSALNIQSVSAVDPVTTGIAQLSRVFHLYNPQRISAFLYEARDLVSILFEAHRRLCTYFPDSPLALDVFDDPEDGSTELVINILTNNEPEEARMDLDAFIEDWWRSLHTQVKGRLGVRIEYQ